MSEYACAVATGCSERAPGSGRRAQFRRLFDGPQATAVTDLNANARKRVRLRDAEHAARIKSNAAGDSAASSLDILGSLDVLGSAY